MFVFVVLLSLLAAVHGKPTGQSDLSYSCLNMTWACHDLAVSKNCQKVSSCIQIWEKIKAPEDNNEICDICKDMVKQARDQLLSNETQEEMKEVFEGSCNLLPIKAIAAECVKVVDEIVPELIEMLASRMDPNMVCTVAGLCNNGQLIQLVREQYVMAIPLMNPLTNKNDCQNCKQGMKFVRKALHLIPKSDFTSLLLHTCTETFQGTSAQCIELISNLLPTYDHLRITAEERLCSPLGKCPGFVPSPQNLECDLCEKFVGSAKNITKAEKAIDGMRNYVLDICDQIESESAAQEKCKEVVQENFNDVISLLWTNESSSDICTLTCGKKGTNIPNIKDEKCAVCKEVAAALQNEARSPDLKNEILNDLNNLCKKTGQFESVCQSFVDQYYELIYDELVNKIMDPDFLCHIMKLCPNSDINSQVSSSVLCHVCNSYSFLSTSVKEKFYLKSKVSVEKHLKKQCQTTFKMVDQKSCEGFMKEVGPIIYNFLKVVGPDTFCGQLKVCPAIKPIVKGVGDNMTCEFCEALVAYVKTMVQSKSTKEEFRTALKNFCADLKEFSGECSSLVDEYYDQMYDFLLKNLDPPEVCGALGLCNGQISLVRTRPAKAVHILPQVDVFPAKSISAKPMKAISTLNSETRQYSVVPGIKIQAAVNTKENKYKKYQLEQNSLPPLGESNSVNEIDQLPVERFMHPSMLGENSGSANCEVCKTVVAYLEKEVKTPKEEDEIRKVLEEVCKIFPKEAVNNCKDFIDTNMDYLINLILLEANPDMICSLIKACPGASKTSANFIPCDICKKVMKYVEDEIGNNKTEEAVKEALEKVCTEMPKKWVDKCTEYVDKYTDLIIDLITHEVAPNLVCAAIGLCPLASKVEGEVECTVCQYVLHYLQEQLMDNATEDEIKKELDKVCTALPKTLADNCNAFVDEFGNSLLVLLAQKLDPSIVCVNFKLCPGKGIYSHQTLASHTIKSLKLDTCSTCQMVVDYMDKLLENDDVDTEISKLIEKICNIIPLASRDQCASIIETYGPYVLQMIGQLSNSKEVCQAVDLCSRSSGHVQLLGGEKCTYGPTYWCQSRSHASACNAEPFCKQQVWKN